jgi:hypothetical protein
MVGDILNRTEIRVTLAESFLAPQQIIKKEIYHEKEKDM